MVKKILLATAAVGLLSACANRWDVKTVDSLPAKGDAFSVALKKEYSALAAKETKNADWTDVEFFLNKARLAAEGAEVLPQALGERDISGKPAEELAEARTVLMSLLDAGARTKVPDLAAKAQAAGFDCWMEEQEEYYQPDDPAVCRKAFDESIKAIKDALKPKADAVAAATVAEYSVFFPTGGSKIDTAAKKVLAMVAEAFAKTKKGSVVVAGHTDASGSQQKNIVLSQKRAEIVAEALATLGIKPQVMALEAYGEERLAVPTKDGVAEAKNRRVEIKIRDDAR